MDTTTLRLPENLLADVDAEAAERDLARSEYLRLIVRHREEGLNGEPNTQANTQENTDRIDELENVVGELAEQVERNGQALATVEEHVLPSGGTDNESPQGTTAEPLRGLVGMVDDEEADRVRERSQEVRASIDEEMMDTTTSATALDDIDFPAGQDRDACLAAIDATCEYLREHGPASMREIVTEVMPGHSLGYDVPDLDVGDRYRGSWWRSIVKPGLETLDAVEYKRNAGYEWVEE